MNGSERHSDAGGRSGAGTLIIRGGMVLTMTGDLNPVEGIDIHVSEGKIKAMGPASSLQEPPGAEVIDAGRCIVMPGLVNAHTHLAMTLFRGYSDDLPLQRWLFEKIFPAEAAFLSPETVYWGALLGCIEMIASGTTCFADGYFFPDETVRAVSESGMRALVAQGVIDFPAPGASDPSDNIQTAASFVERFNGKCSRITPGLFCHSALTCGAETLKNAAVVSRHFRVPIQIHLSETASERSEIETRHRMTPVRYLESIGFLGPDLLAVHAIHIDRDEIERLRQHGVAIAHTPESNMKLCSGIAPIRACIENGITVGLGTDGCASNNDLDMLREMDRAAKLGKVSDKDPTSLDARTVIQMSTSRAASAVGLGESIGTLETGKCADIIVIDTDAPHLCPLYDPYSALVYAARGSDVRDVLIDGEVVMKNRRFTILDPDRVLSRVRRLVKEGLACRT